METFFNDMNGDAAFNLASPYLMLIQKFMIQISVSARFARDGNFESLRAWYNNLIECYNTIECQLKPDDRNRTKIDAVDIKLKEYEKYGERIETEKKRKMLFSEILNLLDTAQRDLYIKMQNKHLIMPMNKMTGKELARTDWHDRPIKKSLY